MCQLLPTMLVLYIVLLGTTWLLWRTLRSGSSLEKVRGPPSASVLTGNMLQLMDRQGWNFHKEIARKYGSVVKLHWLFNAPVLYVFDPAALQQILKDTTTYDEFPWYMESNRMMLGPGVISVTGDTHRRHRKMLTPVFGVRHLRPLVPIFYSVVDKLVTAIGSRVGPEGADIDVQGWMGRTALELIGQSGLGYSFDPLTEDAPDSYADAAKNFGPAVASAEAIVLRQLVPFLKYFGPSWFRGWFLGLLPISSVQDLKHIADTLHTRSLEIFLAKKAAVEAGENGDAKDIMSVLLQANMTASQEDRLPDDELLGQMSSIIVAAMDTTSNAMARILHLLAEHPEVQETLREEVLAAKRVNDQFDYDQLHALPYLDAVCRETLRLYSPLVQTFRGATKDAVLPLSQPIRATDGTLLTTLPVPRGTNILIGILASNCNEALWGADAYEWKPERWLAPLPTAVEAAGIPGVYSNLMTFLGGGRSCIGFTFSQLEMKVVLSELLTNFSFELSDKPVVWNLAGLSYPSVSAESTKAELWLKVKELR
ncbi:cytochrome P450 [Lenzites betulinus]|nr:cytochrome P450 [Lenzites betulinus]